VLHARGPNRPLECMQPSTLWCTAFAVASVSDPPAESNLAERVCELRSVVQVVIPSRQPTLFAGENCCVLAHSKPSATDLVAATKRSNFGAL